MRAELLISLSASGADFVVSIPMKNGLLRDVVLPADTLATQLRRLLIARSASASESENKIGTPAAPTISQAMLEAARIRRPRRASVRKKSIEEMLAELEL